MMARALPRRPQLRLTELGFGAAQGGNLYRTTTDEEFTSAVDAAWEAGVRYFDTAPHYGLGLSERRLGAALRQRPRDEYVVSTKVGRLLVPSPQDAHLRDSDGFDVPATHRRVWDFSRDGVLRSIEASLDRTGLDRIDIVYLHDPDDHWEQAAHEAVPALIDLRDQGVVGAIGAGMNQSAMLARFVRETDVDVMMCAGRFTLLEQGAAADLLPAAENRGGRGHRWRLQLRAAVTGPAAGRRRLQLPAGPGGADRAGPADRHGLRDVRGDAAAGGPRLRPPAPGRGVDCGRRPQRGAGGRDGATVRDRRAGGTVG